MKIFLRRFSVKIFVVLSIHLTAEVVFERIRIALLLVETASREAISSHQGVHRNSQLQRSPLQFRIVFILGKC